ncbi:MAG: PEP-CTERM sorting domain-containing protein [Verrucomicrobiota bacterium]
MKHLLNTLTVGGSWLRTAAALAVLLSATSVRAGVVFDNMSNLQGGNTNAHVSSTGSTPNTFMGDAYTVAAGTTTITGFDLYPVNLSGTSYTGLKLNLFVWGTVNTGTVNSTTPAFGTLLGSYSFTSAGTYNSGFYYPFEGTPVGSAPGYTLGTPIELTSTTIGITFNYQGTTDGVTYNNVNSLTSLISYGMLPTVGSQVFNGYYRNAASETNGNFTSTLRSLGQQNQSVALRIYGTDGTSVPEPGTFAFLGLGGAAVFVFRRRR